MGVQPADEILQDRAFPCALPADDRYLRQVQVARLADGAESVLELVDERDEVFHSPVPHDGSSAGPRPSCSPAGWIKTPNGSASLPAKAKKKIKFPDGAALSAKVKLNRPKKTRLTSERRVPTEVQAPAGRLCGSSHDIK